MAQNNLIQRLWGHFGIVPGRNNKVELVDPKVDKQSQPVATQDDVINFNEYEPFTQYLKDAYNQIVQSSNTTNYRSNEFRLERYKDLREMQTVSPYVNLAVRIYIAEIFSPKEGEQPILCKARDKKIMRDFREWLVTTGVDEEFVRKGLDNLLVYGDAFWHNKINIKSERNEEKGVTKLSIIDPFSVKNRLEFNPMMCHYQKQWQSAALNICNAYTTLKDIYNQMADTDLTSDISILYESKCFGFELAVGEDSIGVPPWTVTHARMYTTEEDFFPFGKSPLFGCLPAWKSLTLSQEFNDLAKAASLPREKIDIKGMEGSNPLTRLKRVDEIRKFLNKISDKSASKNFLGAGQRIYSVEGSFSTDIVTPDIDIDTSDIETKTRNLIMSTGIPDSYMIPSEGAGSLGGENAEALKFLSKTVQRRCCDVASAFLKGIAESYRMHLMLTNKFDGIDTEFELSLPSDNEAETEDHLNKLSAMFDFAKEVMDNLNEITDTVTNADLPQDLVFDVLSQYLPEFKGMKDWIADLREKKPDELAELQAKYDELKTDYDALKSSESIIQTGIKEAEKQDDTDKYDYRYPSEQKEAYKTTLKETLKKNPNAVYEAYMNVRKEKGCTKGFSNGYFIYNDSYIPRDIGSPLAMLEAVVRDINYSNVEEKGVLKD